MVAATVTVRLGLIGEEARDDNQLIPERFQWGERGRELEGGAGACRQPFIVDDAVRVIDNSEPARGSGSGCGRGKRGDHRVEQWQRNCRSYSSKHGTAR